MNEMITNDTLYTHIFMPCTAVIRDASSSNRLEWM